MEHSVEKRLHGRWDSQKIRIPVPLWVLWFTKILFFSDIPFFPSIFLKKTVLLSKGFMATGNPRPYASLQVQKRIFLGLKQKTSLWSNLYNILSHYLTSGREMCKLSKKIVFRNMDKNNPKKIIFQTGCDIHRMSGAFYRRTGSPHMSSRTPSRPSQLTSCCKWAGAQSWRDASKSS